MDLGWYGVFGYIVFSEFYALVRGMRLAISKGLGRLHCYTDSLEVIWLLKIGVSQIISWHH